MATTVDGERGPKSGPSAPPIASGDLLGDRYRVIECIGEGGMGTVFVAEHTSIGKPVAIKVLSDEFSGRAAVVERFVQEARTASLIRHPNIVDITDFGFVRDGVPYFVMEYLEGQTLAQRIDLQRLRFGAARHIMLQICEALQAAHDKGVIHRDMKPDNVFLIDRGGERPFVKVLDFGIAKILTDGDKNLTKTGTVMGTAAYMSPEQAQSLALDTRTDVYAAGIVAYEMLTGRVPFDAGGFVGVLTKHVTERVPSMRKLAPEAGIPRALDRVVLRALTKDRRDRYESAREFADALAALGDDGGAVGWRRLAPVGVAVGLAGGLTAWGLSGDGDSDSRPTPPPTERARPESVGTPAVVTEPVAGSTTAPQVETPPPTRLPQAAGTTADLPDLREIGDPLVETTGGEELPRFAGDSSSGADTAAPTLPGLGDPELGASSTSGAGESTQGVDDDSGSSSGSRGASSTG